MKTLTLIAILLIVWVGSVSAEPCGCGCKMEICSCGWKPLALTSATEGGGTKKIADNGEANTAFKKNEQIGYTYEGTIDPSDFSDKDKWQEASVKTSETGFRVSIYNTDFNTKIRYIIFIVNLEGSIVHYYYIENDELKFYIFDDFHRRYRRFTPSPQFADEMKKNLESIVSKKST